VPALLMRHRVGDRDTWRRVFEEDAWLRQANGSQRELCFRSEDDPDEIWILFEWDDLFRARLFVKSDDLSDSLVRAGVIDRSNFWYLEEADFS
jgi:hypothetical protein